MPIFLSILLIFFGPASGLVVSLLTSTTGNKKLRDILIIACSLFSMAGAISLLTQLPIEPSTTNRVFHGSYEFFPSNMGIIFVCIIVALYPIAMFYTTGYLALSPNVSHLKDGTFLALIHGTIFAGFGVALSNQLIGMISFYELITVTTYPLIAFNHNTSSVKSARSYVNYLTLASSLLLIPATILVYRFSGTLAFADNGILSPNQAGISRILINLLFFAFIFGFAKSALVPLHGWLLKAMVAPVPVSALLHGVIVVKSGLFCIITVATKIFGLDVLKHNIYSVFGLNIFTIVVFFTIFYATIMAAIHSNIKTRLAYSTIGQAAYILLLLSFFSSTALKGVFIQFCSHAVAKITLFFVAGVLYLINHSYDVHKFSSMWRVSAITSIATIFGSLALLGMPPTIGFYSKYYMLDTVFKAGGMIAVLITITASALSIFYVFGFLYNICFLPREINPKGEPILIPFRITFSLSILCLLLLFGTYPINYITSFLG